ncbi:Eisosome component PIL1-domain-containing protein [Apodospora peruviana]|uniref:Eisosome component PIL1-domain-containing protein n=1 Tax=Apodospora peruviana TaxID=516989 RepID=A0AAE0MFH6_9PEZI|nr:Eisosome component PIL1-domain-containing protein [Apodospora peruviana]
MSHRSIDGNRFSPFSQWNRALSIRSKDRSSGTSSGGGSSGGHLHGLGFTGGSGKKGFSLSSLRGATQPELSKRLFRLIKSENNLISAHEAAAKERVSIATQLSEWGEQTGDDAISDISDKVGVVLSEIGEQEDNYAHALDESRGTLKSIRNTEKSVQPSRDGKNKIADEIAKLKSKEPQSARLVVLEQELVRAEAENLVAEAQLTNITRQKLKEAYQAEFLATIERADKQIILARHGLRLLDLLDTTPVVPGDTSRPYTQSGQARQILNDAEDDLRDWRLDGDGLQKTNTNTGSETGSNGFASANTSSKVQQQSPSPATAARGNDGADTASVSGEGGNATQNMASDHVA